MSAKHLLVLFFGIVALISPSIANASVPDHSEGPWQINLNEEGEQPIQNRWSFSAAERKPAVPSPQEGEVPPEPAPSPSPSPSRQKGSHMVNCLSQATNGAQIPLPGVDKCLRQTKPTPSPEDDQEEPHYELKPFRLFGNRKTGLRPTPWVTFAPPCPF